MNTNLEYVYYKQRRIVQHQKNLSSFLPIQACSIVMNSAMQPRYW